MQQRAHLFVDQDNALDTIDIELEEGDLVSVAAFTSPVDSNQTGCVVEVTFDCDSIAPTAEPSAPTGSPMSSPSAEPTSGPTSDSTQEPSDFPTFEPTTVPTEEPTGSPTESSQCLANSRPAASAQDSGADQP